jgi:centromere protein I
VLEAVVDLVTAKTELDQTSITTLIKNLFPAHRIQSRVVITIVGSLGQAKHKPSAATQALLLKWLTVVLDVVEEPDVLSRLYGVLFGMLDMISLRSVIYGLQVVLRSSNMQ